MRSHNDNGLKMTAPTCPHPATPKRRSARRAARRSSLVKTWAPAILATFFGLGCSSDFDPSSLVATTRVLGARVDATTADDRASLAPGESGTVTWLVTAPAATPSLAWAFALCPSMSGGGLGCGAVPFATFQGTGAPKLSIVLPSAAALGAADHVTLFGRICDDAAPVFDPRTGDPGCASGHGTTASLAIRVQTAEANHNPTADHVFTLDGQAWPALAAGADPCGVGPRLAAGAVDHVVGLQAVGADREAFTMTTGDPPAPVAAREALQISLFTTSGKLKTPFAFVEAADARDATSVEVKWTSPKAADVAADAPVTFTFVVRDDRGGADWTTRAACVTPAP